MSTNITELGIKRADSLFLRTDHLHGMRGMLRTFYQTLRYGRIAQENTAVPAPNISGGTIGEFYHQSITSEKIPTRKEVRFVIFDNLYDYVFDSTFRTICDSLKETDVPPQSSERCVLANLTFFEFADEEEINRYFSITDPHPIFEPTGVVVALLDAHAHKRHTLLFLDVAEEFEKIGLVPIEVLTSNVRGVVRFRYRDPQRPQPAFVKHLVVELEFKYKGFKDYVHADLVRSKLELTKRGTDI